MSIEFNKDDRQRAIASIERYFEEQFDQKIGNITAGGLLAFFLEEVGTILYKQGVADAQKRLLERISELEVRVSELDFEVHEVPFGYWAKIDRATKPKCRR
jgi:uncharacterized protein (DUF2164 family)